MDENALEVLEQYDLEVIHTRKGREVYFVETPQGVHMLKEYRGSEGKLEKLWQLCNAFGNVQFFQTDIPVRNKEGSFLVKDSEEKSYFLKAWKDGRECDPRSELDVCRCMEGLGIFHNTAKSVWEFSTTEEREKYAGTNLEVEMQKHTRELKKVQSFIRKKQRKNAFEDGYLEIIPGYLEQAQRITRNMQESGYEELRRQALTEGRICHGDYTQHNVLFERAKLLITNMEHAHLDLQCVDVALFLRKIMEKQGWKIAQGEKFLRAYEIVRPLGEKERKILALRMAYPEKLWKLANHYYHTNKAWIPVKDVEKLKIFVNQQKAREKFVERVILC